MDLHRPLLLDLVCHVDFAHELSVDHIGTAALHAYLICSPTIFHSFGRMALLDDDELALPENLSFECRVHNQ